MELPTVILTQENVTLLVPNAQGLTSTTALNVEVWQTRLMIQMVQTVSARV